MKNSIKAFFCLVSLLMTISAFAQLSSEKIQIAQKKANSIFPFNSLVSNQLVGDVIVMGGSQPNSYTFFEDKDPVTTHGGEYIYKVSYKALGEIPVIDDLIKSCLVAQAKEVERIDELVPGAKNVFKLFNAKYLEVYDGKFQDLGVDSLLYEVDFPDVMYSGEMSSPIFYAENIIVIGIDLKVHLNRSKPCEIIPAELILQKIPGRLEGESIFR